MANGRTRSAAASGFPRPRAAVLRAGARAGAAGRSIICASNSRVHDGGNASLCHEFRACAGRREKCDPARYPRATPVVRSKVARASARGRAGARSQWLRKPLRRRDAAEVRFKMWARRHELRRAARLASKTETCNVTPAGSRWGAVRRMIRPAEAVVEPALYTVTGRQAGSLRQKCDSVLIRKAKTHRAIV